MTRILLVEDNEMNRDMLSRRLVRAGFEVVIAEDGLRGWEAACAPPRPDLVLLDMSLPLIDGWEVASRLKSQPETAGIPIVALTAHAMTGDREKAIAAGCDDYDTKPIDMGRLTAKISRLTAAGRGRP